ncbi:MAG: hypothetical protein U5O69_00040 [Candidatus Competibacteraceae bacterium]|nr:hypothetical protein [Candidatus Competibacteraceae bacterium]
MRKSCWGIGYYSLAIRSTRWKPGWCRHLIGYGADGQRAFENRLRLLQLLTRADCAGLQGLF